MIGRSDAPLGRKLAWIYGFLICVNVAAWSWAFLAFHNRPLLLGTALLAYSFGLRHAVDADHIAAIDNVVRKQIGEGTRPVGVGFFFSLGHSSVVVLVTLGLVLAATAFKAPLAEMKMAGGTIGTLISAAFLFVVAAMNLVTLVSACRSVSRARSESWGAAEASQISAGQGGFLARIFGRLFHLVDQSWHMFPLGFLFGLGFDTASEIALLGISAAEASKGIPVWSIMVFPALFTAGMALVDTTDGVLMLAAYGWAFVDPMRKLFYNMIITTISVVIAMIVGGLEVLELVGDRFALKGNFWDAVSRVNDNFGMLGYGLVALLVLTWMASVAIYRFGAMINLNASPDAAAQP